MFCNVNITNDARNFVFHSVFKYKVIYSVLCCRPSACARVRVRMCLCVRDHVHLRACVRTRVYTRVRVCDGACMCVRECLHVCVCLCAWVCDCG